MDTISIVIIAIFALLALVALAAGIYWLVSLFMRARAVSQERKKSSMAGDKGTDDDDDDTSAESFGAWLRRHVSFLRRRARKVVLDIDDDDDDDELPTEVAILLSSMPFDSIVVNTEGEVLRSSHSAYSLGLVANDTISNTRLSKALSEVFEGKGTQKFDLVTRTPIEVVDDTLIPDADDMADIMSSDDDDDVAEVGAQKKANLSVETVSRRNWLKITLTRLTVSQVVIFIEDVSEQRRFARIRDAFVSNVTEQLLKPTKALESLGTELESEHLDPATIAVSAKKVRKYSQDLNHLVSDLLLLLKAQEPITPSSKNLLDLKPLTERVLARHAMQAQNRGVNVQTQIPAGLMINGQVDQLEGAISKLVDNAIDYSSQGSFVGIAATRSKDGGSVVLRIVDHGKGISAADQPHIFERFWRGTDQSGRPTHGTGLGLSIVKHVALTHHGSVSVWSAPGQGSTFSLTLPAAKESTNFSKPF